MQKVLVASLLLFALSLALDPIAQDVLSAMNQTVDPCQDFYAYSCGTWITNTKLPPDETRHDRSFSIIEDHNQAILLSILQDPSNSEMLTDFYTSCMDLATIEELGSTPLDPWMYLAEAVEFIEDLLFVTGILHARAVSTPLFGLYVTIDPGNPTLTIAGFAQGGFSLPYPDLYLANDSSSVSLRQAYVAHISSMFQLLGDEVANATADAQAVLEFETMIADFTLPPDALVDPFFVYNKIDVSGLAALSPNIPWNMYLQGLGKQFKQATVDVPPFFSNLSAILPNTQEHWVPYLRWQIVNAFASSLSQAFVNENFNFWGKILNGQEKQSPRDEQCIRFTDNALGELLGSFFLDQAFPGESRQMATGILQEIEAAMQADIEQIEWMDNTTRQRALVKLSLVSNMIGGPENPKNYSDVTVNPETFFENVISASMFMMQSQLDQIEQPADKDLWGMTPPTVNAYYDPTRNQMVFPAGIMQQPFFNVSFPKAMNHGGIGMVMGHELTHGFDNQGRDYDGQGKLTNWWLPDTSSKFDQKVQCVINQYSQFEVLPNVYVNGKLTQGENIADMGGIKNSYNAFKTVIGNQADSPSIVPGLTNMELFFVAFAQGWCEKATDEALKNQVETNPHSPAKFRVLGPLINLPEFSDTFKCAQGTPMNPTSRCQVW